MLKRYLRAFPLLLLCTLAALSGGCAKQKNSTVGYYFDTVATITAYCSPEILQDVLAECGRYEALLSKTVEGSDVWRINHAKGEAVAVSADTLAILALSIEVSTQSGGAFDVTIAPASALWDFQAAEPTLPDKEALAQAASLVDYTQLSIEGNKVRLPAGRGIDLGGVAKGYIADALAKYLADRGVKSALINLGGNVKVLGEKPGEGPWRIGVQDPGGRTGAYLGALEIPPGWSLVTSGTYERGFTLEGVRYHHLLDPRTGWPMQNGIAGMTILAESSALADALSTACFVLGPEMGLKLAQAYGAEALYITEDGGRISTKEMEDMLSLG